MLTLLCRVRLLLGACVYAIGGAIAIETSSASLDMHAPHPIAVAGWANASGILPDGFAPAYAADCIVMTPPRPASRGMVSRSGVRTCDVGLAANQHLELHTSFPQPTGTSHPACGVCACHLKHWVAPSMSTALTEIELRPRLLACLCPELLPQN